MPKSEGSAPTRLDSRRARTRAALIGAAEKLLAEDRTNVSVLEITEAADVGLGSFYNHFDSKQALFDAAINELLEAHGALMDRVAVGVEDPAEVFARAVRLTGRLHRAIPGASQVFLHNAIALLSSDRGLAPRALRDIEEATRTGRFTVKDVDLALATAGGAVLALGQLLHDQPERDAAASADALTVDLLHMFGLPEAEAREICGRPLPDLAQLVAD